MSQIFFVLFWCWVVSFVLGLVIGSVFARFDSHAMDKEQDNA